VKIRPQKVCPLKARARQSQATLYRTKQGYDRLARFYPLLEYLTFGRALESARFCHLEHLDGCQNILVVGEGDGRFLARWLERAARRARNTESIGSPRVDVVDSSLEMIQRASHRCRPLLDHTATRAEFHHATLEEYAARTSPGSYDGVVSHFFLDQFEGQQLTATIGALSKLASMRSRWLVSDYWNGQNGPERGTLANSYSRLWLSILYPFFRAITHIPAARLEDPLPQIMGTGFDLSGSQTFLGGVLIARSFERGSINEDRAG
jgi:hypothetical protein